MSKFLKLIHPLLRTSRRPEGEEDPNYGILKAIDQILSEAEDETVRAKIHSSLKTARGEFLDHWGDWFGVYRSSGDEPDDYYRERIVEALDIPRGTNQSITLAIRRFLEDNTVGVSIFEPWTHIFHTNRQESRLNGTHHLMGDYYNFAVIDVHIGAPFPPELEFVINDYKPAGVTLHLTYDPSLARTDGSGQTVIPYTKLEPFESLTTLQFSQGLEGGVGGNIYLSDTKVELAYPEFIGLYPALEIVTDTISINDYTKKEQSGEIEEDKEYVVSNTSPVYVRRPVNQVPFPIDEVFLSNSIESKLNSSHLLTGSYSTYNNQLHLLSKGGNYTPKAEGQLHHVRTGLDTINGDLYQNTYQKGVPRIQERLKPSQFLYFTLNIDEVFHYRHPNLPRTRQSYGDVLDGSSIAITAQSPVVGSTIDLEVFSFTKNKWVRLSRSVVRNEDLFLNGVITYGGEVLNENRLLYLRIRPNTGMNLSLDTFSMSYSKILSETENRPYALDISSDVEVTTL